MIKEKLDILYEKLKEYKFEYAHSSYIVNLEHIIECEKTYLIFEGGLTLDVSRSKSKNLNDRFFRLINTIFD